MNDNLLMKKVEDTDRALQDIVELSILYDFYSELLGEHNKEIFASPISLARIENVAIERLES